MLVFYFLVSFCFWYSSIRIFIFYFFIFFIYLFIFSASHCRCIITIWLPQGSMCFCCVALCKVQTHFWICFPPIEVPRTRGTLQCPSTPKLEACSCACPGLYMLEWDRAKAFLLGKGQDSVNFYCEHFKGTKAMTTGHVGNRLHCLREVSGLK